MLRTPYRKRIVAYCQHNGIVVPHGFDASKSSDKYAVIDMSSTPPSLAKRTTYFEREVIEYLEQPDNIGRSFRILDFKRGLELRHVRGNHLAKIGEFECRSPDELLSLVQCLRSLGE